MNQTAPLSTLHGESAHSLHGTEIALSLFCHCMCYLAHHLAMDKQGKLASAILVLGGKEIGIGQWNWPGPSWQCLALVHVGLQIKWPTMMTKQQHNGNLGQNGLLTPLSGSWPWPTQYRPNPVQPHGSCELPRTVHQPVWPAPLATPPLHWSSRHFRHPPWH